MDQTQPAGERERLGRSRSLHLLRRHVPEVFVGPMVPVMAADSPRPSTGWDAVSLEPAKIMNSLPRSGTIERGRAQRARYLGDDARGGRSRSVSRSRSRSRSPSPGVHPLPQHPKHAFPEPTAFVMMQSQSDIATYSERKVTLSYDQVDRFVRTGEVGPKTRFAIHLLFNAAFIVFIGPGTTFEHDAAHPFPVGQLAMLCDPIVMPLPTLVNLIYSVYQAEAAAEAAAPSRQSTNDNPDWVRI